jgi:hypothetical protein
LRKAFRPAVVCALLLLPAGLVADGPARRFLGGQQQAAPAAAGRFDGNWVTHLACEAHGEMPAYKWEFPSTVKDSVFHGQHGEGDGPGYLVIDGPIASDGSAKLKAKGKVTQTHAHGVFALKGNNYDYNIKAQFEDTKGTGKRDEGAGILGRPCTFEFTKQPNTPPNSTAPAAPSTNPPANSNPGQKPN